MTTNIEWTDHTLNPGLYGCEKISPACTNCYAMSMAGRLERMGQDQYAGTTEGGQWTGRVTVDFDRIGPAFDKLPKRHKRVTACFYCEGVRSEGAICEHCGSVADGHGGFYPRNHRVFVTSMSDLFHKDVPFNFIWRVFWEMAKRPHITFQVLTKRPQRMAELATTTWLFAKEGMRKWPANVWAGTTVESQEQADKRIPHLLQVPASVRFLSVEPMVGPVVIEPFLWLSAPSTAGPWTDWSGRVVRRGGSGAGGQMFSSSPSRYIHQVIAGGESGPNARPMHPDWARSIRDQCVEARVPFFFKQWGEWRSFSAEDFGGDRRAWCDAEAEAGRTCSRSWAWEDGSCSYRVGKKRAGRILDGLTWDEFPDQVAGTPEWATRPGLVHR